MIKSLNICILALFTVGSHAIFAQQLTKEQQQFVDTILPVIVEVNQEISQQRTGIYTVYQQFKETGELTPREIQIITKYAKLYRVSLDTASGNSGITHQHFKELLKRVDIVPAKLALAQAALESDWGKSRFVKEGNNYFGIQCYTPGCGIPPKKAGNKKLWVKRYSSITDCVRNYMLLLNSGKYYDDFRDLRIVNRLNTEMPDPFYVVQGLANYSIKRKKYINSLILIMKKNLSKY